MIQKKVCMLGAFAVGKTSLVQKFVRSVFSEKYHTTLGVKVDQKSITVDGQDLSLMIWDIHGEDEFQKVRASYLRGASGCLLVVDGTRGTTLNTAVSLGQLTEEIVGKVPRVLVINKSDLRQDWEIDKEALTKLASQGWTVLESSAKTGEGVQEAFTVLAGQLLSR